MFVCILKCMPCNGACGAYMRRVARSLVFFACVFMCDPLHRGLWCLGPCKSALHQWRSPVTSPPPAHRTRQSKNSGLGESPPPTTSGLPSTARSGARSMAESPGRQKICLAFGGCNFGKPRPWLGLVYLRRIPSGAFFFGRSILARKCLAKMTKTRQNDNRNFQTMANRDDS